MTGNPVANSNSGVQQSVALSRPELGERQVVGISVDSTVAPGYDCDDSNVCDENENCQIEKCSMLPTRMSVSQRY